MRALISVFDKTGLDTLAKGLSSLGWELIASGGTADSIRELGLDVTKVEDLTEFPEMLGGRVKTLHPHIHAGILARREVESDLAALTEQGIELFDLVCVNLYPFEQVAREHGVREEEAVEMIDIGGPSMLRGAAKNFAHVAPVCRHEDYEPVLTELRASGELSHETRRRLAATAFATSYAAVCANASVASSRRVASASPPEARISSSTLAYRSGRTTTPTEAKFLAAARTIAGPPMSICSTTSSSVAPLATVSRNG